MHKLLMKLLIVAMVFALGTASAFASVWDSSSSEVAVRAGHAPGPDDDITPAQEEDFANNKQPLMVSFLSGKNPTVSLLSQSEIDAAKPTNTSGFDTQFFGFSVSFDATAAGTVVKMISPNFEIDPAEGATPINMGLWKVNAGNVVGKLPNYGSTAEDGYWGLFNADTGAMVAGDAALTAGTYFLIYYVADNGGWDLNSAIGLVVDPVAMGTAGSASDDDDDDDGCVLNPAATLSLEWLFILLAPALLVFRRKK